MGCGGSSATNAVSTFFAWGSEGKVKVKSMKFKVAYDKETQKAVAVTPKHRVTESTLTWKGRSFTLQDEKVTDFEKKISFDLPNLTISFTVNLKDEFQNIKDTDALISNISLMQDRGLTQEQKTILLDKLTKDCRDFWQFSRGLWAQKNLEMQESELTHCKRECKKLIITKQADRAKLETHLVKNFKADRFVELSRETKASAIIQKDNSRPHVVKIRRGSYVHIKTEDGPIIELDEEIRVLIFCWDDNPDLDSDTFLNAERERMQKGSDAVFKELQTEIEKLINAES